MRRINGMYELPAPAFSLCTETGPNKGICISLPTVAAHEGKVNTATPAKGHPGVISGELWPSSVLLALQ